MVVSFDFLLNLLNKVIFVNYLSTCRLRGVAVRNKSIETMGVLYKKVKREKNKMAADWLTKVLWTV